MSAAPWWAEVERRGIAIEWARPTCPCPDGCGANVLALGVSLADGGLRIVLHEDLRGDSVAQDYAIAHELGHHELGIWPADPHSPEGRAAEAAVDGWASCRLREWQHEARASAAAERDPWAPDQVALPEPLRCTPAAAWPGPGIPRSDAGLAGPSGGSFVPAGITTNLVAEGPAGTNLATVSAAVQTVEAAFGRRTLDQLLAEFDEQRRELVAYVPNDLHSRFATPPQEPPA